MYPHAGGQYAFLREGLFFRSCAKLGTRKTPVTALLFQCVWAMVLTLTGSYSELLTYSTFASVLFGGLTVAAVYRLRFKQPDAPRPYRCWGYPVTPALYLTIAWPFLSMSSKAIRWPRCSVFCWCSLGFLST